MLDRPAFDSQIHSVCHLCDGFFDCATAVFNKTPSAPNSIANVASLGVPIPASTITGTC